MTYEDIINMLGELYPVHLNHAIAECRVRELEELNSDSVSEE